jgi:asparagine synthase (glutamine-hydrolysing)
MCGICGVVNLGGAPVRAEELGPMNDALRLRGPDDAGVLVDDLVGLGHRRLSIIDLVSGHQPLGNEDGSVQCVFNGEIYNFPELRPRLEALGHVFATQSDTEVIVHGWEEWGERLVEEIDGMFALAVWDKRQRKLFLARDRFGKKPFVYFKQGHRFAFASTLTALLQHPAAPRSVDEEALARYLALEFIPEPQSIIGGIHKLEAGTSLLLDVTTGHFRKRRFFRLDVRERHRLPPEAEIESEIRARLVAATKKRLMSDVPLGVFLSGGIDSSSVVAAAAEAGAGRIKTFSIGFGERSFDETEYARLVASRFGTDHVEERLDPSELLAIVPRVGEILDEPMADGSIVPTFLLSRLARRSVTVALGGDGGDELFAGYPTYKAHRLAGYARPFLRGPVLDLASRAVSLLPVSHENLSLDFKLKKTLEGLGYGDDVRNYVWLGAFRPDELSVLLGRHVDAKKLYAPVASVYREAPGKSHLERVLYQDICLYMSHEILVKVDRASMANSLEVRAPFLDTAFAEYVAGLPLHHKLRRLDGKSMLKRAVGKWLPPEIIHRPKKGFGMPIGAWLRGPLREFARDLLVGRDGLGSTGMVDGRVVETLLSEHEGGKVDHRKRLWSLIVLELWRRHHLAPPAAVSPTNFAVTGTSGPRATA